MCPENIYVKDSTSCDNEIGYCISGVCLSHKLQCHQAFGNNVSSSAGSSCYTEVNRKGKLHGHCGIVWHI